MFGVHAAYYTSEPLFAPGDEGGTKLLTRTNIHLACLARFMGAFRSSRVTSSLSFFEVLALLEMVGHPPLGEPIKLASCVWE